MIFKPSKCHTTQMYHDISTKRTIVIVKTISKPRLATVEMH